MLYFRFCWISVRRLPRASATSHFTAMTDSLQAKTLIKFEHWQNRICQPALNFLLVG